MKTSSGIVLEVIVRGASAACYVDTPRLGGLGAKVTPESLMEIKHLARRTVLGNSHGPCYHEISGNIL